MTVPPLIIIINLSLYILLHSIYGVKINKFALITAFFNASKIYTSDV